MSSKTLTAAAVAAALSVSATAQAEQMKKCTVVDENGVGLIAEGKGDCGTSTHSCAGQSKAGDPEAWILLPVSTCDALQDGDYDSVSDKVRERLSL